MNHQAATFHSQKEQDRWVVDIFDGMREGFFVDLAAADGLEHSNTLALERDFGWKGLLIEPNTEFFERLMRHRTSRAINCVVDAGFGRVRFRSDNGQLGGIIGDDFDNSARTRSEELKACVWSERETVPLAHLLDQHGAPDRIHYLSLDIEGAEEAVLSTFPFDRYIFLSATIERPTPKVNELLLSNGYLFVKNFRFDTFYVHATHPRLGMIPCQPFEQVPPKNW